MLCVELLIDGSLVFICSSELLLFGVSDAFLFRPTVLLVGFSVTPSSFVSMAELLVFGMLLPFEISGFLAFELSGLLVLHRSELLGLEPSGTLGLMA